MKLIFTTRKRTNGKPEAVNEIWKGAIWYYIIVRNEAGGEYTAAFDGGLEHPFSFPTGGKGTIGDYARALIEDITRGNKFYYRPGWNPYKNNGRALLVDTLYRIYHGEEGINARIAQRTDAGGMKIISSDPEDQEEVKFCQGHFVYRMSKHDIRSDSRGTYIHTSGTCARGPGYTLITCKGRYFFTDSNDDLYKLLCNITAWNVESNGTLRINGSEKTRRATVAWIVDRFSRRVITRDTSVKDLKALWEQGDKTKEMDHLTENQRNNFSWALIETEKAHNQHLLDHRTRIRAPYYFYTVNDRKRGKLLVECGVAGFCYRKRFVFDELGQEYLECFDTFKEYAKAAGYFSKNSPKGKSLLTYWGEPERAGDPQNPLVALLSEDINTFERYSKEVLADIPLLV